MCSNAFIETYFRGKPHSLQARMRACIVETGIAVGHNGEVPRTDAWRGAMRGDQRATPPANTSHHTSPSGRCCARLGLVPSRSENALARMSYTDE